MLSVKKYMFKCFTLEHFILKQLMRLIEYE